MHSVKHCIYAAPAVNTAARKKSQKNRAEHKLLSPHGQKTSLPCLGKVVQSRAQIPRIELVWFLELGFLEVVMQEVSRKALPGDF